MGIPEPKVKSNHGNLVLKRAHPFLFMALIYFSLPIILSNVSLILSGLNIPLEITESGP